MKQDIKNPEISAQARAERVAERMLAQDKAARNLGIRLNRISPGAASMSMEVKNHHLNGHAICHGGIIFTLADTAFAFACNSHNQIVVAQHNTISFLKPVAEGEILTAEATETSKDGRSGIYDVKVSIATGDVVAHFRGNSRVIQGQHFDENKDS